MSADTAPSAGQADRVRSKRGARVLNPVLRRELLERWRSRRAVVTVTVYLAVMGLALWLMYRVGVAVLSSQMGFFGGGGDPGVAGPMLGRFLFEGLLASVLFGVLFVTPGYAAGQVAGERERRTLSLLQTTMLRPSQIVLGKLGAAVAWLSLLVVATLPLGAAAFFLGGVGVAELLRGVAFILVIGLSVAAMALGFSALTKRTVGAIVLTYGLVLALAFGTLFAAAAEYVLRTTSGATNRITPVALYLNPVFGLADAVRAGGEDGMGFGMMLPSPLGVMAQALPRDDDRFRDGVRMQRGIGVGAVEGEVFAEEVPMEDVMVEEPPDVMVEGPDVFVGPVPMDPMPVEPFERMPFEDEPRGSRQPVWLIVMGAYLCLGALGLVVATSRVRRTDVTPRRRGRGKADPGAWPAPAGAMAPNDEERAT